MVRTLSVHWLTSLKLVLLMTTFFSISMIAQDGTYTVSGSVTSLKNNTPLPGVTILVKGATTGAVSDFDGNYSIKAKDGDILEFSFVGFTTKTAIAAGQAVLNIALAEDTEQLDEIVVVGYGTQKRKNLTGSISKVSGKKLENLSIARVDDALVGRVSGVQIAATNPEAGGDPKITIRGVGSISGDSNPLIVVDGIALGTDADLLGSIDMNNVKSIEVLKDASSVAIFGSRGANGVIIVTSKEGVAGQTVFNYNTYTGVKWVPENEGYTGSAARWRDYLDEVKNDNLSQTDVAVRDDIDSKLDAGYARLAAADVIIDANGGEETDWQGTIIPGGVIQSHSFSATGGSEQSTYIASVGYLHDEGVLVDDDFKKYTAAAKLDTKSKNKKIKFGINLNGAYTDQKRNTDFVGPLRQSPWLPTSLNEETLALVNKYADRGNIIFGDAKVGDYPIERMFDDVFNFDGDDIERNADGTPKLYNTVFDPNITEDEGTPDNINTTGDNNALAKVAERNRTKKQMSIRASSYLEFKLAKGLKFKQTILGDYRHTNDRDIRGILFHQGREDNTERDERDQSRAHYGFESLLTYKRDLGNHSIDAVGGFSFDNYKYTRHDTDAEGFLDDFTTAISLANILTDTFTQFGEESLVSYFGRLNYDFDDRYLVSLSARTDGSSRFGANNRYGFFPAASVGWRISNESFLADSDLITGLKLRASYGISGSNAIDRDIFQSLYRFSNTLSTVSYDGETGVKVTTLSNPNLGWESLIEFNPGLDLEIANGLFSLGVDYYRRTSEDLILDLPIGSAYGVGTSLENVGKVQNSGFEVEASLRPFSSDNFSWTLSGLFTKNKNEVLNFGDTGQLISRIEDAKRPTEFITQVGGPISAFYGYVYDKEIPLQYIDAPFNVIGGHNQEVYVKDINGDGVLNSDDRTKLGDPYPDFQWSATNTFYIHDFDLSFMFQGSHGGEVRVSDIEYLKNEFKSSLAVADVDENFGLHNVPNRDFIVKRYFTSDHIQDASFVSLRNVSLGYTLPSDMVRKLNMSKVRIYLNGENLIYITADEYFGFNPEGSANYVSRNANTPVTAGYQRAALPIARTLSMGVNVQF